MNIEIGSPNFSVHIISKSLEIMKQTVKGEYGSVSDYVLETHPAIFYGGR